MMHQWKEDVIVAPHCNTQATAMSVDLLGKLALLGSRRHLTLINLNEPKNIFRRINLNNKWDISRVVWNPFPAHQQYFLTTYNQWADLWDCNETSGGRLYTFSGHTRAISDVDWSPVDPNLMATCSLDTYIYLWDIRETKKPKLVTSTVSGASRVRWNKFIQHTIASSHDGNIRVWDIRKGKSPTHYITAHVSKINHIDWSSSSKHELSSASQDSNVSFWDTTDLPRNAKYQIRVPFPVWRAEYTPFGTAMASVAFKSFRETPFMLWNLNEYQQPVHTYNGHTDVILDFQWRRHYGGWQLVTWSKDQILRLWPLDHTLLAECGAASEDDVELPNDLFSFEEEMNEDKIAPKQSSSVSSAETQVSESTRVGTMSPDIPHDPLTASDPKSLGVSSSPVTSTSLKSRSASTSFPHTLEQEFKLLNIHLPNLIMNQMDKVKRICTMTLKTVSHFLVLQVTFPIQYPQNEAPVFKFVNGSDNIDQEFHEKLLKSLQDTAQYYVRNSRSCLDPCLRKLTSQFREMSYKTENKEYEPDSLFPTNPFSSWRSDLHNIPFPRTSGARFCGPGYLVIFLRPTHVKGFHSSTGKTPRSFASLNHRGSIPSRVSFDMSFPASTQPLYQDYQTSTPSNLVSSFYYKEKKRRSLRYFYNPGSKDINEQSSTSTTHKPARLDYATLVVIADFTRIMPISKALAGQYIIPKEHNFSDVCQQNKEMACKEDMNDLVQLWSCVGLLPRPARKKPHNEFIPPFQSSPMGRLFLSELLTHYSNLKDVQTLAMLSCAFEDTKDSESTSDEPIVKPYLPTVKRSISQHSFDMPHNSYPFHKSPSESRFGERSPWWNIMSRSPSSESTISKYHSPCESPSEDYRFEENVFLTHPPTEQEKLDSEHKMLDRSLLSRFDLFKLAYCELLERWKMNVKVAEIRQHSNFSAQPLKTVFEVTCHLCGEQQPCSCKKANFKSIMKCVICQLPVRSMCSFCSKCFHGGHAEHMNAWFRTRNVCPSSPVCSCNCVTTHQELNVIT